MWINSRVASWLMSDKDELAKLRSANEQLTRQLAVMSTNFDWLRMRVNQLEAERVVLLQKAYNINVAIPEITRTHSVLPDLNRIDALFEHIDDKES
jgi:hypothetical protein